jgi:hypothetical protein
MYISMDKHNTARYCNPKLIYYKKPYISIIFILDSTFTNMDSCLSILFRKEP